MPTGKPTTWALFLLLLLAVSGLAEAAPAMESSSPAARAFQVVFATNEDYDISLYRGPSGLAVVERDFQLIKELGVDHLRVSFSWSNYEPQRGHFRHLKWLRQFVELAHEYGITLLPYLCYAPSWATIDRTWNAPPRDFDDWYNYVYRMVSEFKDLIGHWELWNEQDIKEWWSGSFQEYARLLEVGARAVRDADPTAKVLLGGLTRVNPVYIQRLVDLGLGDAFDIVPIHAYPESWSSYRAEDFLTPSGTQFDALVKVLEEKAKSQPIWINEMGYPTTAGRTETDQANMIRRAIATLLATGQVELIGWYEIKDLYRSFRAIGNEYNYHLGLTRVDQTKKIGFDTYRNIVQLFNHEPLTLEEVHVTSGDVPPGTVSRNVRVHAFRRLRDDHLLIFAWALRSSRELDVSIELPGLRIGEVREYDLNGRALPVHAHDGSRLVDVRLGHIVRLFEIIPPQS